LLGFKIIVRLYIYYVIKIEVGSDLWRLFLKS
jgi:hypothetical protein